MSELLVLLIPELAGLIVTPAAIIGTLVLLGSPRPVRNLMVFGGTFLLLYLIVATLVVTVGDSLDAASADPAETHGWIRLVVGLVLLTAGVVSLRRRAAPSETRAAPRRRPESVAAGAAGATPTDAAPDRAAEPSQPTGWMAQLADPTPQFVFSTAVLLAVVNPNLAILCSALAITLSAEITQGQQTVAVAVLLAATMIDFVVPAVLYALGGRRGRRGLRNATGWLLSHDRVIGAVVLLVFGILFTVRGSVQLFS